jgi:hypothetical protein
VREQYPAGSFGWRLLPGNRKRLIIWAIGCLVGVIYLKSNRLRSEGPPCSGGAGANRAGLMSPTRLRTERAPNGNENSSPILNPSVLIAELRRVRSGFGS